MSELAALDPAVASPLGDLIDGIWDGRVDAALVERCRRRICLMLGADPSTARHRDAPQIGPELDERDHACLAFAEQWMLDPHAVTDALAAGVTDHLAPAECAAFTIALAVIEAQVRAEMTLGSLR